MDLNLSKTFWSSSHTPYLDLNYNQLKVNLKVKILSQIKENLKQIFVRKNSETKPKATTDLSYKFTRVKQFLSESNQKKKNQVTLTFNN